MNNTRDRYREHDVTELLNRLVTVVTFIFNIMTHNELLVNYQASLLVARLLQTLARIQTWGIVVPNAASATIMFKLS
jgi:hypothetical protein